MIFKSIDSYEKIGIGWGHPVSDGTTLNLEAMEKDKGEVVASKNEVSKE